VCWQSNTCTAAALAILSVTTARLITLVRQHRLHLHTLWGYAWECGGGGGDGMHHGHRPPPFNKAAGWALVVTGCTLHQLSHQLSIYTVPHTLLAGTVSAQPWSTSFFRTLLSISSPPTNQEQKPATTITQYKRTFPTHTKLLPP